MKKRWLIFVGFILIFIILILISASNIGLIENSTWQNNLTGTRFNALTWGDIDNDGDLDLVDVGCLTDGGQNCNGSVSVSAKVYINNGTTFTENSTWQQNLTAVGHSSASFGDIDNDGDLDLVLSGCTAQNVGSCIGSVVIKVYINNGTTFTENSTWQQNLTAIWKGNLVFTDIDNDGKIDLGLIGATISSKISKIYINNGTSLVENSTWQQNLTGLDDSSLAFADINNDGKIDLGSTGEDSGSVKKTKIYINNGSTFVENSIWQNNLTQVSQSGLIFGDYDNDGDMDLVIMGCCDRLVTYTNNGSTFTQSQTNSGDGGDLGGGLFDGTIGFGDYDNDGTLDFVGEGRESGRNMVYQNNGSGYFLLDNTAASGLISDDYHHGGLVWGDFDSDNDLDLIVIATEGIISISAKIYINNNTVSNTQPSAPNSSFSSNYSNNQLNLSWGNGSDIETPALGLYYNLMVGNSTQNHTIVSGVYGGSAGGEFRGGGPSAGYFGNMMQRKSINLNVNLSNGTYYWYVQTIDTGLAKSSWSERKTFTVGSDTTAPVITSVSSSVTSSTATIIWTTDESANSTVLYGTTTALGSSSDSASLVTSHSIGLSSLSASTLYYYNVSSCDSSNNCDTSIQFNFTTSSAAPSSSGGGGGGGGTITFWTRTDSVSDEDFEKGFVKELSKKQRVKISVNSETHYIGVVELTNTTATINITSDPIQLILNIGDDAKLDVLDDGFYDIYVLLNDITNNKANLTIQSIYEEIPEGKGSVETSGEIVSNGTGEETGGEGKNNILFWSIVGFVIVLIVLALYYLKKYLWERKLGKRRKIWKKEK